ncbi:MAG: hypothetical protein KGL39_29760 [Patescibacteria group bacterium]|nr:hypothetical protein [Patescibacteria group bacterium]
MSADPASALVDLYRSADPSAVKRGRHWYRTARRECRAIAQDTGYSVAQVAAVMAITSPDAQLVTNIGWTRVACESDGAVTVGRYPGNMMPKIRAALGDRCRPGQYATGPKVSAFYRGIMGDRDALVVDRWAAFAAGYPRSAKLTTKARREIERAYHEAASRVGESLRDFQAIIWIAIRESTLTLRRGQLVPVKLVDIT